MIFYKTPLWQERQRKQFPFYYMLFPSFSVEFHTFRTLPALGREPVRPRDRQGENVVPEEGVEPSRPCGHGILSPARLPVPPLRRCPAPVGPDLHLYTVSRSGSKSSA